MNVEVAIQRCEAVDEHDERKGIGRADRQVQYGIDRNR